LQKRIFATIIDRQKDDFLKRAKRECGKDSACIEQTYQRIIADITKGENLYYATQPISGELVLAAGSWNIKEAIPLLENALGNNRYNQSNVLMALARLGNDSIQKVLIEKYTLSYVLENSQLDTINDKALIYTYDLKNIWTAREGIEVAMYLRSKEILLNVLDLIYIKGISESCIGSDCFNYPDVSFFIDDYCYYKYFNSFDSFDTLRKICKDYRANIWRLYRDKQDVELQQELEVLLSTEYRTKLRNQIREWIIENVNF
jgi:uncharacterized protein